MPDFTKIDYLLEGGNVQRDIFAILNEGRILPELAAYDPILVGSIPLMINVDNSDVDLICCYGDRNTFTIDLINKFGSEGGFTICQSQIYGQATVTANFEYAGYAFEIFGQEIPTRKQLGYRHMIIEQELLQFRGSDFRDQVVTLKKQGMKTEPAFCKLLGLSGNPYFEILKFENLIQQ